MSDPGPLRVLLVADDALARAGLRLAAEAGGLKVVAEGTPEEADVDAGGADAVVWDVGSTDERADAHESLRAAAAARPLVAVLWGEEQARDAIAAGARAVLLRDRLEERLGPAVSAAVAGIVAVDAELAELVLRPPTSAHGTLAEPLTARETEVLQLLAEGLTNRRIGERLGISEHTAKFHVNAILGKLGARTRGEAIAQAARLGLLLL